MALQRQVQAKMAMKRDPERERQAIEWVAAVSGESLNPEDGMWKLLGDGIVLCKLINKLAPGTVKKINTTGTDFKLMENINNFTAGCRKYGVPITDIFQTVDLWEGKDLSQVTATLFALGRTTYQHPDFPGPHLGPRPAEEAKRNFSEETIAAGKATIGLQAGTNKGASQSGMNIGAGRKIFAANQGS